MLWKAYLYNDLWSLFEITIPPWKFNCILNNELDPPSVYVKKKKTVRIKYWLTDPFHIKLWSSYT